MISAINAIDSTDYADIPISDDAMDELIATTIYADNLMDCDDDAAVGSIADINSAVFRKKM